jgi:hypothetical protein
MNRRYQGGAVPEKIDYLAADASYSPSAPKSLGVGADEFMLVQQSPTVKVYKRGNDILIALRGTKPTDTRDLSADVSIAVNRLAYSDRVKADEQFMDTLLRRFPSQTYNYYVTGHSLGGAELLVFMRKYPFIKGGVAWNSALQPQDLVWQPGTSVKEIYVSTDPLYRLMGHFLARKTVIDAENLSKGTDILSQGLDALSSHKLSQFAGLYR